MAARVLAKGNSMEFAVFILLLLIALALASPFISVMSFVVELLAAFAGLVVRAVRALIGSLRRTAARDRGNDCDRADRGDR